MRTRKELLDTRDASNSIKNQWIIIDLLLDIRDLLKNLKTSPNKDFKAQSVSPKVCPQCYPNHNTKMIVKKGEYWICPECSRCIEGKPS